MRGFGKREQIAKPSAEKNSCGEAYYNRGIDMAEFADKFFGGAFLLSSILHHIYYAGGGGIAVFAYCFTVSRASYDHTAGL